MSKNLSFENSMKDNKNEEFFAFVKDYNALKAKEASYQFANETLIASLVFLLIIESLGYYLTENNVLKGMVMFGSIFMFIAFIGKTIKEVLNGTASKNQRKKDVHIMNEKAEGWIEFLKVKENKVNIARDLIIRLENLEKIKFEKFNKENIDKMIESKKEDIYNLVKYGISKMDFYNLEILLIEINNIESNTYSLLKSEQELKQIKKEIHSGITNNLSNSFKEDKKTTSFN